MSQAAGPGSRKRTISEAGAKDVDLEMDDILGSDVNNILQALQKIKAKSQVTNQKKSDEVLARVQKEIKLLTDEAKAKADKDRQSLTRQLAKTCKDFEESLKSESDKFDSTYKKFKADQEAHLQAYEDIFTKFGEMKERLLAKLEHQRKKDKSLLADLQTHSLSKLSEAEAAMTKAKKEASAMRALKKSLGSMFEGESEDDGEE